MCIRDSTGAVHDFAASGEALLDALRDTAGLTASSHILDLSLIHI